jgi:uncharacterized membrane protein HdeD (DUF308 family)
LIFVFAAYMLIDGIFAVVHAFTNRTGHTSWWVLFLEGLLGIATGIITFLFPGLATVVLIYLVAFWAMATGILEIIAAIHLRKESWAMGMGGMGMGMGMGSPLLTG